jgi:aminoglycoside 6'-N-acetyltransferase
MPSTSPLIPVRSRTEPGPVPEPAEVTGAVPRPTLAGQRVLLRPGDRTDAEALHAIQAEPAVAYWWGEPGPVKVIAAELRGTESSALLVIEIGGQVAGGIQYHEEDDPMYRHAGIDIYLGDRFQGRGAGPEAVSMSAAATADSTTAC